jgi:hypothetical protein
MAMAMLRSITPLIVLFGLAASMATAASCASPREGGFVDDAGTGGDAGGNGGVFDPVDAGSTTCVPDPANYDIPGNGCDDDGDGTVDNPPACDSALAENGSAEDFARALGICTKASDKGYGLVSATFTQGYDRTDAPEPKQHGVLSRFGAVIRPLEGARLGVLSTGWAKEYDGTGNQPFGGETASGLNGVAWGKTGALPPGFPKETAGCPTAVTAKYNDVISLKLEIKAPPNAGGLRFDFDYYSGEWPAYVCTAFNDGFIAYLTAKGFNGGKPDNVSTDKSGNPITVNTGFFDRCTPNVETACALPPIKTSVCPGGADELAATGFGISGDWCSEYAGGGDDISVNGGATGWLTSRAPVEPGETFTLELMIWDTSDGLLDSSVLLDNFTWEQGDVKAGTDRTVR